MLQKNPPLPPADNSDVFFITGKTDDFELRTQIHKAFWGEERLLIGRFQLVKSKFPK